MISETCFAALFQKPLCQLKSVSEPTQTMTDLKRAVVNYIARNYVHILEACGERLQVRGACRISNYCEYHCVGSTGLGEIRNN